MTHRTETILLDNEGRKINYKIRTDVRGEYILRYGMRGVLETTVNTLYGTNPETTSITTIIKRVAYYEEV